MIDQKMETDLPFATTVRAGAAAKEGAAFRRIELAAVNGHGDGRHAWPRANAAAANKAQIGKVHQLKPSSGLRPNAPFDKAFLRCRTLPQIATWYDVFTASGRKMSADEFTFFVDYVSGVRALERMTSGELAVTRKAEEFADFFYGQDHPDFGAVRENRIEIEDFRFGAMPRQTVWTLGSILWCLRASATTEDDISSPSIRAVKLIEYAGQLIRKSLKKTEPAEPLVAAFAQGVLLGYYQIARIAAFEAPDAQSFWRSCELSSIHQIGLEHGQRIRSLENRDDKN